MKEIKEMTVEEMIETLDHFYMDDCLIKQYVDSSFVPTMIDRLRDEFNIFYHPGINVEKTQFGTRYKVVLQYEKLDQAYKDACESFKKELTQILGLCEYESNSMVIDKVKTNQKLIESYKYKINELSKEYSPFVATLRERIRSLEQSENSQQKRISELITKCNELIDENKNLKKLNKNLKKLYETSIEKQYRLETDNAELLRKVKIQDDSEKVISNLKKKQEETERLLHESVEKVNEECKVCVQYERSKIKDFMIAYLKRKRPVFYNTHTVELITNPLEDVFKMSVDT